MQFGLVFQVKFVKIGLGCIWFFYGNVKFGIVKKERVVVEVFGVKSGQVVGFSKVDVVIVFLIDFEEVKVRFRVFWLSLQVNGYSDEKQNDCKLFEYCLLVLLLVKLGLKVGMVKFIVQVVLLKLIVGVQIKLKFLK